MRACRVSQMTILYVDWDVNPPAYWLNSTQLVRATREAYNNSRQCAINVTLSLKRNVKAAGRPSFHCCGCSWDINHTAGDLAWSVADTHLNTVLFCRAYETPPLITTAPLWQFMLCKDIYLLTYSVTVCVQYLLVWSFHLQSLHCVNNHNSALSLWQNRCEYSLDSFDQCRAASTGCWIQREQRSVFTQ